MNRVQFWIATGLSGLLFLLVIIQFLVVQNTGKLAMEAEGYRQQLAQAQTLQPILQGVAVRLAKAGETEPELKSILAKHKLQVNFNANAAGN
jgi:hypothetical protein